MNRFKPNNLTQEYFLNCYEYFRCLFSRKPRLKIYYKLIPYSIHYRQSGNTTRIVDECIQDFFMKGECRTSDHYGTSEASKRVYKLVITRLINEHNYVKKDLFLNFDNRIIRRKKTHYEHNQN